MRNQLSKIVLKVRSREGCGPKDAQEPHVYQQDEVFSVDVVLSDPAEREAEINLTGQASGSVVSHETLGNARATVRTLDG